MARCALLLAFSALAIAAASTATCDELKVVYPRSESVQDQRISYPLQVLRGSLEKSGVAFSIQPSAEAMQQARSLRELAAGNSVSVVWSVASRERDAQLRRIRIPIDRGLIGWRVLFIRKDDERFDRVRSLADLSAYTAGQGHDWPDVAVLRANGLTVTESPTYEGLFAMLARGHIDYFPRAVSEVDKELAAHGKDGIALEPRLLLAYREGLYFYVNRNNAALAEAIESGLRRSIEDGTFAARFEATYRDVIDRFADHRLTLPLHDDDQTNDEPADLWLKIKP